MNIKNLLKEYQQFKANYNFKPLQLKDNDGCLFVGEVCVDNKTNPNLTKVFESETFINVSYGSKTSIAKVLSNLYPYRFKFRGKWVASIEGVLQGIKYKDKASQNKVLKYSGLDAYHTRACNSFNVWNNSRTLYWQGKPINRDGQDYQNFIDELYLSVAKNPLYRRALKASGDKYLLHAIGVEDKTYTVLTREEYELRMNSLRAFLQNKGLLNF